jgi:hypothetical protein
MKIVVEKSIYSLETCEIVYFLVSALIFHGRIPIS